MKETNLVLCDTTIVPSYEDYKDWCEMNEVEPQGEDSNDYWEFVGQIFQNKIPPLFLRRPQIRAFKEKFKRRNIVCRSNTL